MGCTSPAYLPPCQQRNASGPGPFRLGDLSAASSTDVAVTCFGLPAMGYQPIEVFVSADGGRRFRTLSSPAQIGLGAQVVMTSPTTLLLGTSNAAGAWVLRSVSPFSQWSRQLYVNNAGAGFSDMAFVDPDDGALLVESRDGLGEVYLTRNGGSAWRAVDLGSRADRLLGLLGRRRGGADVRVLAGGPFAPQCVALTRLDASTRPATRSTSTAGGLSVVVPGALRQFASRSPPT